ncbi:MAG: G/U mismatch-specific DNA glycosylase [Streptosporangiaceae bacterium]
MDPADLQAARNRTIPDVLPPPGQPLHVLFCGINPSLYSAATGWHFARPGNRFWPALHLSGFTPRRLAPHEQHLLPGYGLGITNLVARATAQAAELDAAELRAGGERLLALLTGRRPGILAIAGVTAYRTAFGHARADIGPQPDPLGGSRVWVLPNPSGLNAHWTLDAIAAQFAALRAAASAEDQTHLSRTNQVPAPASPASVFCIDFCGDLGGAGDGRGTARVSR